jgi:cytochrome c-type biogenesis protein CcmE
VAEGKAPQGKPFRIGGLVKEGSLRRPTASPSPSWSPIPPRTSRSYKGILPDLFKEGKGAVKAN